MKKRNWLKLMAVAVVVCATAVFAEENPEAKPAGVKGNPTSKIYHKPTCRHYTAKGTTKAFETEAAAVKAGYTPCKQCAAPKKTSETKKDEKADKKETASATSAKKEAASTTSEKTE